MEIDEEKNRSGSCGIISKKVFYEKLPIEQKFKWTITENVSTLFGFHDLLGFLRRWSTKGGHTFERKKQCCTSGYPLVEVEVLYNERSLKLLISRATLYILAFYCLGTGWWRFKDPEIYIYGFPELTTKASYTVCPCDRLGPREVISAFWGIQTAKNPEDAATYIPVFMFHISEASRFYIVEREIERTLLPQKTEHQHWNMLVCSKPIPINLNKSVRAPPKLKYLIKKFSFLSKIWILYALTQKRHCYIKQDVFRDCGFKNKIEELDSSIAVLANVNIDKMLTFCKGILVEDKAVFDFPWMTIAIIEDIERNLEEIRRAPIEEAM